MDNIQRVFFQFYVSLFYDQQSMRQNTDQEFQLSKKKKIEVILYYLAQVMYGMSFYVYGPLVPYFAAQSNLPEAAFVSIFMARGTGYILGGLLKNTLFSKMNKLHQGLGFSCLSTGLITLFLGMTIAPFNLTVLSFFGGAFSCFLDIFVSVCLIKVHPLKVGLYISRGYAFQALGALLSPLILSFLGLLVLQLVGVYGLIIGAFIFWKAEPDTIEESLKQSKQLEPLNKKAQFWLCVFFFIWTTVEHSFKTWLPTFLVITKIATKEESALVVSYLILILIISRFVLANAEPRTLIKTCLSAFLFLYISSILGFSLHLNAYIIYIAPFIYGIIGSLVYPLTYALPITYGFEVSVDVGSRFVTCYAIGEATLAASTGYFMEYVHPISVFAYPLFLVVILLFLFRFCEGMLEKDQAALKEKELGKQLLDM